MKILALVPDAFGGRGGMAQFNRDMLRALCAHEACAEVLALPRVVVENGYALPDRLEFAARVAGSKTRYLAGLLRTLASRRFDLVLCGHLNLLPAASVAARRYGTSLVLVIYGIDAWTAPRSALVRRALARVDLVVAISAVTRDRFLAWAGVDPSRVVIIPPAVDLDRFVPGTRRADLQARYGLAGRTVIMTVGRLAGSERYKGFDEVIELLPVLERDVPSIHYLIVGDGPDRERLAAKARDLGVADRLVFAGYIPEEEKPDHYRLADAYVMPSRGEGFGIVYLEAMACGVPVIGSRSDGSREALPDESFGRLVDPSDREALREAIRAALELRGGRVPSGLERFGYPRFEAGWHRAMDRVGWRHA